MKKTYQSPSAKVVNLKMTCTILAGSVRVSSESYSSDTNGDIRSRQGSIWDDIDDED